MASRNQKFHGRIEGAAARCGAAGCAEPGEYRAPVTPGDFDGPGEWRYLCLDHVRVHNSAYNFFTGMSPDEIEQAQSPIAGWERTSRPFAHNGSDPPPAWSNFHDPLDAIAARFRSRREDGTRPGGSGWGEPDRFTSAERRALHLLGLRESSDRTALRQRYAELVRRFHPDRNGGDRSHEAALAEVIEAYTLLKRAAGFA